MLEVGWEVEPNARMKNNESTTSIIQKDEILRYTCKYLVKI